MKTLIRGMLRMLCRIGLVFLCGLNLLGTCISPTPLAWGQPPTGQRGHLMIIGGALRLDNRPVIEALIKLAGGVDQARIAILPTAGSSTQDSHFMAKVLGSYGLPAERVAVLDVTQHNAPASTSAPAILAQVRQASCVFLSGGDQLRLVRVLTNADGSDTPLLAEIRAVLDRGGVIAGTSAGASAQSATMLAVSGLPDRLIDEGFDALDFGIRQNPRQRGLLIAQGLGFFRAGIIDQHFYHLRGRLARLIRAVDHCRVAYGFGIEENTALIVAPSGQCRVLGAGLVTILQTPQRGQDSPSGYSIQGVRLTALSSGDMFDPQSGAITIEAAKPAISAEQAQYNGNFLISDIGSGRSAQFALISGLAENQKPSQDSIMLKHYPDWTYGYRLRLRKTDSTGVYAGLVNGEKSYSLIGIQVDIAPIANGLKPAVTQMPTDVASDDAAATAIVALAFRGILPLDDQRRFRGAESLTRGQLAAAMARSTHLYAAEPSSPRIDDLDAQSMAGEEIYRVVAAGIIGVDDAHQFRPDQAATADQAAHALRNLAARDRDMLEPSLSEQLNSLQQRGLQPISRHEFARLLFDVLKFDF